MPMIMVCPKKLSFRSLVENFLNANEDLGKDIPTEELIQNWKVTKEIIERMEGQRRLVKMYGMRNPFSGICPNNITREVDKRCDLLMFLNWVGSIKDEDKRVHGCIEEFIPRYVANIIIKEER